MAKPTPNLSALRDKLRETATPAVHTETPAEPETRAKAQPKQKTQLIGAQFYADVGKELRQLALNEDTEVRALLAEAINMLLKSRGRPQIASVPKKDD